MMALKNILLLLSVGTLCGLADPTSAPTSAPTTAPTSAPTSSSSEGDKDDKTNNEDTSKAETNETKNDTAPEKAVTSFTAKMFLSNASDFNETAYLASIAAATGVGTGSVKVKSVNFVVSVSYKFADSVTETEVVKAVAANANVPESAVTATISAVRRLSLGRRLAVTADVEISTPTAAKADTLTAIANNAAALASKLSEMTSRTIAAPEITAAPKLAVVVKTEVVSSNDVAVAAPTASQIGTEMSNRTGKTITAEVTDVVTTGKTAPTNTTESSPTETSGSPYKAVFSPALLAASFASVLAACA